MVDWFFIILVVLVMFEIVDVGFLYMVFEKQLKFVNKYYYKYNKYKYFYFQEIFKDLQFFQFEIRM